MANKQIIADELFNKHFELLDFSTNNQDLPIVLLAGGIHGNEIRGIEAVSHLVQSLKKNDNPLISNILSKIRLYVIPRLNVVGNLAGARCCPQSGEIIQYNEETQEVILPQDQKGSMKIPQGWADPNRLWNDNVTLAKMHLDKAIKSLPRKPDLVIFPHDWAATQPIVKIYERNTTYANTVKEVQSLLGKYYPSRTPFGKQWDFVRAAVPQDDSENLSFELLEQEGIPSFVIETYLHSDLSVLVHYQILLYVLSSLGNENHCDLVKKAYQSKYQ